MEQNTYEHINLGRMYDPKKNTKSCVPVSSIWLLRDGEEGFQVSKIRIELSVESLVQATTSALNYNNNSDV